MKRSSLLILGGIVLLASVPARADTDTRQVWRDRASGEIVHNTWGNCVRGNWENYTDVCGTPEPLPAPKPMVYAPPPPPPPPRTVIAQEDRTVYFAFDKTILTDDSKNRLNGLADRITSAADVQGARVVGYADRMGTVTYNEKLSKKRAEKVRDYLISRNVVTAQETDTQWVGETKSSAACGKNLTRQQMIECLSPDRKVTVELMYKQVIQDQNTQAPATRTQYQQGQDIYPRDKYPTQKYLTAPPSAQPVQPYMGQPPVQPQRTVYPSAPDQTGL